jgi:hypothetical protein
MPNPPTPDRKCAVEGCRAWAIRDQRYCAPHYHQWQENKRLGAPDPTPRIIGRNRRLCQVRSCKNLATAGGPYCTQHTQQFQEDAVSSEAIAEAFAELIAQLDAEAPDSLAMVQHEVDLLATVRKILVAHAEMASRTGWKGISAMTFIRLWLSSAATVNDLAKARFVIENATGNDIDRLLSGVYHRIDAGPVPEQRCLPGLVLLPDEDDALPLLDETIDELPDVLRRGLNDKGKRGGVDDA